MIAISYHSGLSQFPCLNRSLKIQDKCRETHGSARGWRKAGYNSVPSQAVASRIAEFDGGIHGFLEAWIRPYIVQGKIKKISRKTKLLPWYGPRTNLIFYFFFYRIGPNSLPILCCLRYLMHIVLALLHPPFKEMERWGSRQSGNTHVLNISVLFTFRASYCE